MQKRIGELPHDEPWSVLSLPKPLVEAGAWVRDEVLAHDPFDRRRMVWRSPCGRAGRPFWRTLLLGASTFSEARDRCLASCARVRGGRLAREFVEGGVNCPYTLVASTGSGVDLL